MRISLTQPVKKILIVLQIIVINLIGLAASPKGSFGDLYLLSGGFIWLPLILIYINQICFIEKKYFLFTFYKLIGFFIGDIINVLYLLNVAGLDAAGFYFSVYLFIGLPFQVIFVLLVDKIGKKSSKKH